MSVSIFLIPLTLKISTNRPRHPDHADYVDPSGRRGTPGSLSFVPSAAGLLLASEAVRILLENKT